MTLNLNSINQLQLVGGLAIAISSFITWTKLLCIELG